MKKDKMYTSPEYQTNPLYRKMRERFSVSGDTTIGDFMRSRAKRDGYPLPGDTVTLASPIVAQEAPSAPLQKEMRDTPAPKVSKTALFFKRHLTFFACVALFLCISLTLAVIIPVCSNFTASAGEDGMGGAVITEKVPEEQAGEEETPVNYDATFENILNAFDN